LTHISIIKFQLFVPLPKEVCAEKICNEGNYGSTADISNELVRIFSAMETMNVFYSWKCTTFLLGPLRDDRYSWLIPLALHLEINVKKILVQLAQHLFVKTSF